MEATLAILRQKVSELGQEASDKHDARAALKASHAADVEAILQEKIEALDTEMHVDAEESDSDMPSS